MKIALLTHSVLPRGGVVHTLALADALLDRGHDVTVIAPVEPGQHLFTKPRARVVLLSMPAFSGTLVEQVRDRIAALTHALPAVFAAGRFELLHAQDSLNANALATIAAADPTRPPWVRTVHHLDDFDAPELHDWQQRGWQQAGAIGCVSALWCRHFEQTLRVRVERLYNGVDLARFTPLGPRLAGGPFVLALGGVEARKNTPRLLEAFALAGERDPAWRAEMRLVVAGGASLLDHTRARRDWHERLAALGLAEGDDAPVQRLGPLPHDAVPMLMRSARVVAMPSLVEGFGLVALEALACGTPVLVSQRPPFTEHLAGCAQVAWCDPEQVPSITAGLLAAARIAPLDEVPAVCREHSWQRSASAHEAWYGAVLARHALAA